MRRLGFGRPHVLHKLQRDFAGVSLANALEPLLGCITSAHGSKERRLGVYRTNTLNSLTDVLSAAFPVIHRIVGDRFFRGLAKAFIETRPPKQPVLWRYGSELSEFLKTFAPTHDLPYLPDVARLEWARIEAYFAADFAPLDPQKLATVSPENLGSIVFALHPAFHLVDSPYPVFEIWAVNQPDCITVPQVNFAAGEQGMVFRRDHTLFQRILPPGMFTWLRAIEQGAPLATAAEQAAAADDSFDLQNSLRQQLADGAFTDIRHEPPPEFETRG
jgi:hypothetical protein